MAKRKDRNELFEKAAGEKKRPGAIVNNDSAAKEKDTYWGERGYQIRSGGERGRIEATGRNLAKKEEKEK